MFPRMFPRMRCFPLAGVAIGCLRLQGRPAHLRGMELNAQPPLDHVPMWTMDDLAEKLRISKATIHTWRKRGTAPRAYRIGRHLMFAEPDVRAWLVGREASKVEQRDTDSGW